MSISAVSGPVVSYGQAPYADYNPEAGPSLFYSGVGILDPRPQFTYEPGQAFGNITAGFLGTTGFSLLTQSRLRRRTTSLLLLRPLCLALQ